MELFFLGIGLSPLVPVKGTVNAAAYKDILDNFMLPTLWPTLWEQFGMAPSSSDMAVQTSAKKDLDE